MKNYRHLQSTGASVDEQKDEIRRSIPGAIPCFVESFDYKAKTASLSSALTEYQETDAGDSRELPYPKFEDIPVLFPGGGGVTITWPLEAGDPVLLVPCSRDIAEWFVSAGNEPTAPDYDEAWPDGAWFCLPRLYPEKRNDGTADGRNLIIQCGDLEIQIEASKVRLGSLKADKALALAEKVKSEFQAWKAAFDAHTHVCIAPGSPCMPPAAPGPTPSDVGSTKVFTDA